MKKIIFLYVIFSFLPSCTSIVSGGAQAAYNHHAWRTKIHDHFLAMNVDDAVHWRTDAYKSSHVSVSAFNNVVVLTGQTLSEDLRANLEPLARTAAGKSEVYNLTTVGKPVSPLTRASDSWITAKIKTRLLTQDEIDPGQIKVITENGVVYLIGTVYPKQALLASDIARSTDGVEQVVRVFNYLHVNKTLEA